MNQYIKSVEFTDLAIDQFRADLIGSGRDQVFYQMSDTLDIVSYNAMIASAVTDYFANGKAALSATASGDTLKAVDLRKLLSNFRNNNVKTMNGGTYSLVLSPYQIADLQGETTVGGWAGS